MQKKFKKPIFTSDELDENKTGVHFGYSNYELLPGYNFARKPFTNTFLKAKEKLDGTQKKRECHEKINNFGWARMTGDALIFGIKFQRYNTNKLGTTAIQKYKQLLGYYLEQAGWKDIRIDDNVGDYVIPMNNPENIKLLYTLSPSIGFYYKSERPTMEELEKLEYLVEYETQNKKTKKSSRIR